MSNAYDYARLLVGALHATQLSTVMETDDAHPGRTNYEITGPTREAVQGAIDKAMRLVDTAFGGEPGMADFAGPLFIRTAHVWFAKGFVQLDRRDERAA